MRIEALLFDLDNTLVDRDGAALAFAEEQARRFGLPAAFLARFVELDRGGRADRRSVFAALAAEFGLTVSGEGMAAEYRRSVGRYCTLFPGAEETLRELRERGYRLGIVTNGSVEAQTAKIAGTGLGALVDAVLISAREGMRKPDPAIFHRAAQRLNAPPERCLFVGDDPRADILGAASAGMGTVWKGDGESWPPGLTPLPDNDINQLTDLLSIPFDL